MTIEAASQLMVQNEDFGDASAAARPRLLIVDDIADNRTILNRRFTRRGFDVVEADSGKLALALIEQQEFDTVLLDVMMPEMDGIEVLKRIREKYPAPRLPVVMVTAKSQSEDIVEALKAKANDYITKPVDFAVALARVGAQIELKRAEDTIARANAELKTINDNLEQRVAARTGELVEANRQLKEEIALRLRSEAESRHLALHDSLTGLANRVLFRQELQQALDGEADRDALAVLFIDLDGFKSVNDTLGHSVGDSLLKHIGTSLGSLIGEDDLIARLGGDEFAVLNRGAAQPVDAERLADKIVRTVAGIRTIDGNPVTVGASVGIVFASDRDPTPEDMLRNADLAMYKAKSDGRGIFRVFDPVMSAVVQERRQLEIDIMTAFVHGQFRLYYQPLISLDTNQVCAFEALLRWQHPERGIISPTEFIPIAEENGLIIQLGDWVIREACVEATKWTSDVRIGVNVSPVQFMRGNVVNSVVSALAFSGLAPERLEIEITESILLEGCEQTLNILNQLRELGVRIVMDDFGTGYSSLGYLRSFPFDKIKIDQSFVRESAGSNNTGAIVQAIAELGRKFGISTTAEGVETQEQLQFVMSEGCSEAQGWIFSQPIPSNKVQAMLDAHNTKNVELLKQCTGPA